MQNRWLSFVVAASALHERHTDVTTARDSTQRERTTMEDTRTPLNRTAATSEEEETGG
jgi:hypothetical protein